MARSQNLEESIAGTLPRRGASTQAALKETIPSLESRHQKAPRSSAKRLTHACDAVAAEIEETGKTVVNLANTIAAETEALAELLRKHGAAISDRVEEFVAMSDRVADRMRAAHNDVLSTTGTAPSLTPQAEHGDNEERES